MDRETVASSLLGSVSKGREIETKLCKHWETGKISIKSLNGKLNWPCEENVWLSRYKTKLRQTWRLSIGKRKFRIFLFMRSSRSASPNDYSLRQANMENWKWGTDSSEKIKQKITKKLKNWGGLDAKKKIERDKHKMMTCLCVERGILRLWVNCWLQLRIYRTLWIACQMRENFTILKQRAALDDTHVPSQPSTVPSTRTIPCRDSGLPHDTWNTVSTSGERFWTTTCSRRTNLYSLQ